MLIPQKELVNADLLTLHCFYAAILTRYGSYAPGLGLADFQCIADAQRLGGISGVQLYTAKGDVASFTTG